MPYIPGVPLVSLFGTLDQINQALPAPIQGFLNRFSIIDLSSQTSPGGIIHRGRIQSLFDSVDAESENFDFGWGTLEIPLLTEGVPFQFSVERATISSSLEPTSERWQLDLLLDSLTLTLRDLVGADYVAESGTLPRHLIAKSGSPPVAITGSAAMRLERAGSDQPVVVKFIDAHSGPDPFVPMSLSGGIAKIAVSPPHFMIGTSNFGMTVKNILFDYSREYSPPFVIERGQPANWVGLAIDEITLYTPANATGQGGFSAGIRNFLIGDPAGLQVEFEAQWGVSAVNPTALRFEQDGTDITSGFNATTGILSITASADEAVELRVSLASAPTNSDGASLEAQFVFSSGRGSIPGGGLLTSLPPPGAITGLAATGEVQHDSIVHITPIEIVPDGVSTRNILHEPFRVRIVVSGEPAEFAIGFGGTTLSNVALISGTRSQLGGQQLDAVLTPAVPGANFRWVCAALEIDHRGTSLTLALPDAAIGEHDILLTRLKSDGSEEASAGSRLRLRIRDPEASGALLIGCESGVFDAAAPTAALTPTAVLGTYDLTSFHTNGTLTGANGTTTLSGSSVDVPEGAIAEVALDEGGAAAETEADRRVQILYEFDKTDETGWGSATPAQHRTQNVHEGLLIWANKFPGATFLVIGRCDDCGSDAHNVTLAQDRADAISGMLTTATGGQAAITGTIDAIGEQSAGMNTLSVDQIALIDRYDPPLPTGEANDQGRYIFIEQDTSTWPQHSNPTRRGERDAAHESLRIPYRRADVYAIDGTPMGDVVHETRQAIDPTRRRVLVPDGDRTPLTAQNPAPQSDYRVKLVLAWDRARFSGWKDIVPNLAEFEYVWTNPAEGLPPSDAIGPDREQLTIYGKWIYDDLTGFTELVLGLKSDGDPDGILATTQKNLVAALTFGPMLASNIDFDNDAFGSAVRLAALGTLAGFASSDLLSSTGETLIATGPTSNPTKSALKAIESRSQTTNIADPFDRFKTQLTIDYTSTVHVNAGAIGLKTDPNQPMKIRYSKIGIEFDNTDPNADFIDKFGFVYASDAMTIEDSGLWQIEGPLAQLLRVTQFRMGNGSFWIEPTLALSLSLGVVEVSEASFRVTFNPAPGGGVDAKFSLRGLTAKVDIPAALKGEGSLKIEDGGVIKASLDITVVPLKIRAMAALAIGSPPEVAPSIFMNLYARVQFPGGIPLGPIPLAIHGFIGQTVINGTRDVTANPDVVTREIGWWRKPPQEKYKPLLDQHALGVGVVVGTLPDASFSFSATGMVVVAFPDPSVILGVEVEILSVPDTTAKDEKQGNTASITGLVVIDTESVTVAVSAQYEIPKVLKLKVPFAAYFPGSGTDTYVRIGSDGHNGRAGSPITIEILPTTLNLKAWSYLMIEGGGILELGAHPDFNFEGFSIGFGAGIDIEWKAGPIGLEASAKILVGMGTDPLLIKGGFFVSGKLDLVVISVSVRGDIIVTYLYQPGEAEEDDQSHLSLEGEFCGSVDMFFFSIEGCIDFSVGTEPLFDPPPPPPPAKSIALVDRNFTVMGEATSGATPAGAALFDFQTVTVDGEEVTVNEGVEPKDNHTVWPDTAPVINFGHYTKDNLPAAGQFDPREQPTGDPWFGSNRLKYAYRLDSVALIEIAGDGTETPVVDPSGSKLDSVWTFPPSRPADDTSEYPPSGAEITHLQLLDWEPWAWARPMENGGEGQPGDPVEIIDRICEPGPDPALACLLGADVQRLSALRSNLRRPTSAPLPYRSWFTGTGDSFVRLGSSRATGPALLSLLTSAGLTPIAGTVINLPVSVNVAGRSFTRGYKLPAAERLDGDAIVCITLPWQAALTRRIVRGELLLLVCDKPNQGGGADHCYTFGDLKTGIEALELNLSPFVIRALDPQWPLRTQDAIDASRLADPQLGADGQTDIEIGHGGASIDLKVRCHDLTLHYWRPGDEDVKFEIFHADGSTTNEVRSAPASVPMLTRLTSDSGIVRIVIKPGGKAIQLYRVCCDKPGQGGGPADDCIRMDALPKSVDNANAFQFEGAEFSTIDPTERFFRRDNVNTGTTPAQPGADGLFELQLPPDGTRIKLPVPCQQIDITLMQFNGRAMRLIGFDRDGTEVAAAATAGITSVSQTVRLTSSGQGISVLELLGGAGEAMLISLCCQKPGGVPPDTSNCIDLHNLPRDLDGKAAITVDGVQIKTRSGQDLIRLTDQVRVGTTITAGADRQFEIAIPSAGLEITLAKGCTDLEVHVMLFAATVTAVGFDATGKQVAKAETPQTQRVPHVLRLTSASPIVTVVVSGGSNEAVLYRLCCRSGDVGLTADSCVRFDGAAVRGKVAAFRHQGLIFRDAKRVEALTVDTQRSLVPLNFADSGLRIDLPRPAASVRLQLSLKRGSRYEIRALDRVGKQLAADGGRGGSGMTVTLEAKGIAAVQIETESGGQLLEVCARETRSIDRLSISPIRDGVTDVAVRVDSRATLPRVRSGLRGGNPDTEWPAQVISTHQRPQGQVCQVVRYRMPDGAAATDLIDVEGVSPNRDITLLSLCGVDEVAQIRADNDQIIREEIRDAIEEGGTSGSGGSSVADGRPVLLKPGTRYEIRIGWSWQSWQGTSDTDNAPAVPSGTWEPATEPQVFRFRTASEASSPARQDGLNEFIFDPRDIDRYLVCSEPANGGIAHFTDDPIVFHFAQNHIPSLLEGYGRELDIVVRRTDPPPQSGVDITTLLTPLTGTLAFFNLSKTLKSPFDQRIDEAIEESPCLDPENPITPGQTLVGDFELEPNAMYDVDLNAVTIAAGDNAVRVSASRFVTSRYANPGEMLEAFGFAIAPAANPSPPGELVINAGISLPSSGDGLTISDSAFDSTMADLGLETLGLPDAEPRVFQLWQVDSGGGAMRLAALLLDGVEPINREASVVQDGSVERVTRCRVERLTQNGRNFVPVRQTQNATRILLVPQGGAFVPNNDLGELIMTTSDGPLTGRRTMRIVPLVMEVEGF